MNEILNLTIIEITQKYAKLKEEALEMFLSNNVNINESIKRNGQFIRMAHFCNFEEWTTIETFVWNNKQIFHIQQKWNENSVLFRIDWIKHE